MPKGLKIVAYILTGLFSFILFLYLTFPFEVLKDRILANVEKSLKSQYEIDVGSVSPSLIFGVSLKDVKLLTRDEGQTIVVWEAKKVKLKVSLISLMLKNPAVKFDIRGTGGRISGRIDNQKTSTLVDIRLNGLDLGKSPYIQAKTGLNIKSDIDGEAKLQLNLNQIISSTGTIQIKPNSIQLLASKLKIGSMGEIDLPAVILGAGESVIAADLKRGAIRINPFNFEKGDLNIKMNGSVYLSSQVANYRLNLQGDFDFSEKIGQALPFLFIIEKQKGEDGKYPLTISGRLARPQIKIGDFTVPM